MSKFHRVGRTEDLMSFAEDLVALMRPCPTPAEDGVIQPYAKLVASHLHSTRGTVPPELAARVREVLASENTTDQWLWRRYSRP